MQFRVMLPLIIFDASINLYLTLLFVIPLRSLYSYQSNSKSKSRSPVYTIALRSFVGSLGTLTSSVVNLTVLMVLRGEAAWICLMCCNADVLFSVLVLHWVTARDGGQGRSAIGSNHSAAYGNGSRAKPTKDLEGSLPSKLDRFDVYGKSYGGRKSFDDIPTGVVTHISAQEMPVQALRSQQVGSKYRNNGTTSPIASDDDGIELVPTSRTSRSVTKGILSKQKDWKQGVRRRLGAHRVRMSWVRITL